MEQYLALLCCLALASGFVVKINDDEVQWKAWKAFHGKSYKTETEENARKSIWRDNLKKIAERNSKGHSYTLAMNQFGDLTHNEYQFIYLGMRGHFSTERKRSGSTYMPPSHVTLPEEVDWRQEGYVTPVKDQGHCGSCWAFSATGSLEGQHFRKTGQLVSLSEQNLVDCSRSYGNNGCQGGTVENAFRYIQANGGIDNEASYPYEGYDSRCRFRVADIGATDSGYQDIPRGDEQALKSASATVGPISVAIDASNQSFQFYSGGVYDEPACNSSQLNHAVLVVGYGTYGGQDYWLVKNSWGTMWGLAGYIMMSRNKNNQCGIATDAIYPVV